ncbi:MAG: hypothetical protein ACK5ZG_09830 [Phycisphaerae bacterium]|jgi:hypothetical protein
MTRATTTAVISLVLAGASQAAITTTGGDAVLSPAPASTLLGAIESNTIARAFNEVSSFTLATNLPVNATTPGVYSSNGSLTPGVIAAGTVVNSHYLYVDPVGDGPAMYEGFVEFDQPILGVIVLRNGLNSSDFLGAPGTTYGDNVARGMELSGNEAFTITLSQFRVNFRFNTTTATDDIRIITAVPAPGAAAMIGLAATACLRRRRNLRG